MQALQEDLSVGAAGGGGSEGAVEGRRNEDRPGAADAGVGAAASTAGSAAGRELGGGRNYTPLVNKLALYFQIRDDLINLSSPEYMSSKSYCEDLTEGKFSFPILHAITSHPHDQQLLSILKQRTESV
jgi:geranylgeranyl pyrophosphate synthase